MKAVLAAVTVLLVSVCLGPQALRVVAAGSPEHQRLRPDAHGPAFIVRNEGMFQFTATIGLDGTTALDKSSNFGCVHLLSTSPVSRHVLNWLLRLAERLDFFELPHILGNGLIVNGTRTEGVTIVTRAGARSVDKLPSMHDRAFDTMHSALMRVAGVSFDCALQ